MKPARLVTAIDLIQLPGSIGLSLQFHITNNSAVRLRQKLGIQSTYQTHPQAGLSSQRPMATLEIRSLMLVFVSVSVGQGNLAIAWMLFWASDGMISQMNCISVGVFGAILVPPRQCLPGLRRDPGRVPVGRRIKWLPESQRHWLGSQGAQRQAP
ncbi:uncharacterized protein B0T15DRAFT_234782 [Chaetomium strumarium]|uniref:Uncharacterized protein n=1 Tax=Chaetomium strumarium TaxID=1170767 RepID=A0AAJ0GQH2_9PEZI|nr:hypothetical protein B0T15DRAFT_234782 [Chaetomium strumarium]